jgi:hypothetical protein
MEGSILLHRQLLESYVFANPTDLKIWIWLLLKARYKKGFVPVKIGKAERTIALKRGQLIFGRHKAEEALKIDGATIARHLNKMKDEKMILIDVSSQYSIITICNYDSYQTVDNKNEQPMSNQRAGDEQPMSTNNKDNKVNKEVFTLSRPDLSKSNLYRQPNIPAKDKVHEVFVTQGGTKEMSERFYEMMEAVGWYYKSSPVTNFTHLVPKFIDAWKNNLVQNHKKNGTSFNESLLGGRKILPH